MYENPGKGAAIASLVLGIIGLCTIYLCGVGCIIGIVSVVLAVNSANADQAAGFQRSGLSIAGMILGILAIVLGAGCLAYSICSGVYAGCVGCVGCSSALSGL